MCHNVVLSYGKPNRDCLLCPCVQLDKFTINTFRSKDRKSKSDKSDKGGYYRPPSGGQYEDGEGSAAHLQVFQQQITKMTESEVNVMFEKMLVSSLLVSTIWNFPQQELW